MIAPSASPTASDDGAGSADFSSPRSAFTLRVVKQKLEIDGSVYELEEIYGMSQVCLVHLQIPGHDRELLRNVDVKICD